MNSDLQNPSYFQNILFIHSIVTYFLINRFHAFNDGDVQHHDDITRLTENKHNNRS